MFISTLMHGNIHAVVTLMHTHETFVHDLSALKQTGPRKNCQKSQTKNLMRSLNATA